VSLEAGYFDRMYAAADDPWSLTSRWYEQRKYALTIAALPRERYRHGLEAGCSIGVLTALLAERCDRLLAVDIATAAVRTAASRTRSLAHVSVQQRRLPEQWPDGEFDLIVLSELGYYFSTADLQQVLRRAVAALVPGGTLLAVHWRHPVQDYPGTGDEVHQALLAVPGLTRTVRHEELDFLLEVYLRTPPAARSVAEAAGLA
jgi:SAM-dependent methyltransferase